MCVECALFYSLLQSSTCIAFTILVERKTGRTDGSFWDWLNTDFIPRKESAAAPHRNTDTLHSRGVRQRWDALITSSLRKVPWQAQEWVEWQIPWGKDKALQITIFLFKTRVNTLNWKQTLWGLGWKLQTFVTSKTKSTSLAKRCALQSKARHSFSFPSRKLWIFWKFSSCWPRASSRMPMGDLFRPAPSILFSSLFFMLRRRNEACADITEKADAGVTVNVLHVWQKQTYKLFVQVKL